MYILSPRICNELLFLFTFVTNSCCILAKEKQHVYPVASVPTSPAFHHNPRHGKHFPSQSEENIRRGLHQKTPKYTCHQKYIKLEQK